MSYANATAIDNDDSMQSDSEPDEMIEDGPRLPPKPVVVRPKGVRITEADLTAEERAYADAVFPHRKAQREGERMYGKHPTMRELRERHGK